jgi:hypothetical protein
LTRDHIIKFFIIFLKDISKKKREKRKKKSRIATATLGHQGATPMEPRGWLKPPPMVFMHSSDKEGHPVCYNVYGEFQNKEMYQKIFFNEEKRQKFLKWRIQFLERSIWKLDFSPGGICTIVQVNDLKNSPGPGKRGLRQATKQALQLLQDNYIEFIAKQVFINVPWWYLAVNRLISPFLTQRTKSKVYVCQPFQVCGDPFEVTIQFSSPSSYFMHLACDIYHGAAEPPHWCPMGGQNHP